MQLVLQPKEQEVLVWALQSTVSDLGSEIADTEKQEFREDLKERKAVLVAVHRGDRAFVHRDRVLVLPWHWLA